MNEVTHPQIETIQKKKQRGILLFSLGFGVGFISGLITFLIGIIVIGTMAESIAQNSPPNLGGNPSQSGSSIGNQRSEKLALLSTNSYFESGYAITEGQVKNIGDENIENVEVVVTWKTEDGEFIKSDSSIIDYDPILRQQTSPFKVLTTRNPKMHRFEVSIKRAFGGTIDWVDMRKKSK